MAARSSLMDWARSAKTVAKAGPNDPFGDDPAARAARDDSTAVCCTALSRPAWSTWRLCPCRSVTRLRTMADVSLDWSATTAPCAARARFDIAS